MALEHSGAGVARAQELTVTITTAVRHTPQYIRCIRPPVYILRHPVPVGGVQGRHVAQQPQGHTQVVQRKGGPGRTMRVSASTATNSHVQGELR